MNKDISAPCDLADGEGKASPQWARPTVPLSAPPLLPSASSFAPNALRPSPAALLTLKTNKKKLFKICAIKKLY